MNKTTAFLATAAVLALIAVVVGLPKLGSTPSPVPVVTHEVQPLPAPLPPSPAPLPKPMVVTDGSLKMEGRLSHPFVAAGRSDVFVTVDVSAVEVPGAQRAPVNVALVLDRSGSMYGEKLARAKEAALRLVERLNDADRLAIVHYGSDVRVFSSAQATAENKARMGRFIRGIIDDGGTNIAAGLRAGHTQLAPALSEYRVNRVILISDGQPTEGVTSHRGLTQVAQKIRASGISVSALGVGNDFNEDLMTAIAEVGAGSYGFIQNASAMAKVFEKDLEQASTTVAQQVTLKVDLPPGVALAEVLGWRHGVFGQRVEIPLPDFAARQTEKVVLRLSMSPGAHQVGQSLEVSGLELDYKDLLKGAQAADLQPVAVVTQQRLSAYVTDKREELATRDATAVVTAVRAQTAVNYKKAAEHLSRGDTGGAARAVRANDALFDEAEAVAGREAVAADRATSGYYFGLATQPAPASQAERQNQVKQMKVQSLRSSGRGESVY